MTAQPMIAQPIISTGSLVLLIAINYNQTNEEYRTIRFSWKVGGCDSYRLQQNQWQWTHSRPFKLKEMITCPVLGKTYKNTVIESNEFKL